MEIPFNRWYRSGREIEYIHEAISSGEISGNGAFTRKCHRFFEEKYGLKKCFLTSSCTDALEMAALLAELKAGDEVIMPSYTFASAASAFILRGVRIVFCDSEDNSPNIDPEKIESLIRPETRVIVAMHYSGIACDMDRIMKIAEKHRIYVIEDAAHAVDSFYKDRPLGSIGHFGCFSFHQTKNITAGEGGMISINDKDFFKRAEKIWEKSTDREAFRRGEVDKYSWVELGSSFLPSDITAAFLYAQLENIEWISEKRRSVWNAYYLGLKELARKNYIQLPKVPFYAKHNGHIFHIVCRTAEERLRLSSRLCNEGIGSAFHYQSLHRSPFYIDKHDGRTLPNADRYSDCLLRLPLNVEMSEEDVQRVILSIENFWR